MTKTKRSRAGSPAKRKPTRKREQIPDEEKPGERLVCPNCDWQGLRVEAVGRALEIEMEAQAMERRRLKAVRDRTERNRWLRGKSLQIAVAVDKILDAANDRARKLRERRGEEW